MEMKYLYTAILILSTGAFLSSLINIKKIAGFISSFSVFLSSVILVYFSVNIVINEKILRGEIITLSPFLNSSLSIHIDALSALFLIIIAIVSLNVTIFSWKYLEKYETLSSRRFYPFLLFLFLSSILVVSVSDLLFFIISWEFLTLCSWFLIISNNGRESSIKVGLQYFITMHIASAFLILATVIVYSYNNDFSFYSLRDSFKDLIINNPVMINFVLFCFFITFVTKAGVLPFGAWLPNTYPQAPTSVSSFFGGVMSKLGIYALIRFFYSLLPISTHTETWGFVIVLFGFFSIFIGTIAAITQDEAKRLMSFHAIGQVGYILLGVGLGLYFIKTNPYLAIIALTGGVLHAFNNSIYKSLLFLNAGSIFYKTGTTDLNKVSGLIGVMPIIAITALVGSLSIAGVPLFNGFVSKLLIFQSSIWTANDKDTLFIIKFLFIIFGIISIFISAITLASFLKFLNSAFMGKVYGLKFDSNKISWQMNFPQIFLAFICLFIGLFPIIVIKPIYISIKHTLSMDLLPYSEIFSSDLIGFTVNFCKDCWAGAWFPIAILIPLSFLCLIIFAFERYAKVPKREVETWYGGKEHSPDEVMYRGHSFYQPFKNLVSFRIGKVKFKGLYPEEIPILKFRIPKKVKKILYPDEWFYYPIADKFIKLISWFDRTYQSLSKKYMLWLIFGILIVFALLILLMRQTV